MNQPTPQSRRAFLGHLAGLAAAPFAAAGLARAATPAPASVVRKPVEWIIPSDEEVLGRAIKAPSNRIAYWAMHTNGRPKDGVPDHYQYWGDWDGTFKLERDCTNPAYILADLYERTGEEPDWAVARHYSPGDYPSATWQLLKPSLDWEMLYHWGMWCDEIVTDGWEVICPGSIPSGPHCRTGGDPCPRLVVYGLCANNKERERLWEMLRMHCLRWQSTDLRYRTSWPGVPRATIVQIEYEIRAELDTAIPVVSSTLDLIAGHLALRDMGMAKEP